LVVNRLFPLLVAGAAIAAYSNSFSGAFIFDDHAHIVRTQAVRHPAAAVLNSTRPLVNLTFHLNYRLGGLNPADYHLVNLAVHVAAALVLFGTVRRALELPRFAPRSAASPAGLAATVATFWAVHPVQTESVTYIVQRAEAMMGLFYFLTFYCFLRSLKARVAHSWQTTAVIACALGMACKPVMVTAPAFLFLFDLCFVGSSFREILASRKRLYQLLAATLVIPAALLAVPNESTATAGFTTTVITPGQYLLTQPRVLLHYLRLIIFPRGLCLDYAWPPCSSWHEAALPATVILALLAAAAWGTARRHPLGYLGVFFFGVLAPTSSFIPIADCAVEHRLYVPLAAAITALVISGQAAFSLLAGRGVLSPAWTSRLKLALVAVLTITMIAATRDRNQDYWSEPRMWADVLTHRPDNLRARHAIIEHLLESGNFQQAEAAARDTLAVIRSVSDGQPQFRVPPSVAAYCLPLALDQLGRALLGQKKYAEAIEQLEFAVQVSPSNAVARYNLALAFIGAGQIEPAMQALRTALALEPHFARAYVLMGNILVACGKPAEAVKTYGKAIQADPGFVPAKANLAWLLATVRQDELRDGRRALELALDAAQATARRSVRALDVLAAAYAACGKFAEAAAAAEEALQLAARRERPESVRPEAKLDLEENSVVELWDISFTAIAQRHELYKRGIPFHVDFPFRK